MASSKREIQEINAGSMADIAFLLLIFFLVATTMNVDTGLVRILPPMPEEEVQQDIKIKERNLLLVLVSGSGDIMVGNEKIDISALKEKTREFVENIHDDENLPEKLVTDFKFDDGTSWTYPVSQGVVSLQTTRETNYDVYMLVQNELTRAFGEVREKASRARFGKSYVDLPAKDRDMVTKAIPLKISEAEPRLINK
ncbi:MAG: biopolymer transporter ExbD [Rikenellaceae bacterium]